MAAAATSLTGKEWSIGSDERGTLENIVDILLENRGLSEDFLQVSLSNTLPDPYVFADMQRAAERIVTAILNGESIAVLGDYDVDGVSSTAILVKFFRSIGVDCSYAIPDRMLDGYGLNINNIKKFKDSLIITVDNGAAALEELAYAHENNIEVIVIDHHRMSVIPENTIVVDPFRPDDPCEYKYLCATGLAMICVMGIDRELQRRGFYKPGQRPNIDEYMDLVALATVCDVVPLVGLNRAFVQAGLKVMETEKNIGIREMRKLLKNREISAETAGFYLGPRLNAAGRLASAEISLKLLTASDPIEAKKLAARLEELNEMRKDLDQDMLQCAEAETDLSQKFICAYGNKWHAGVIGIVAGRLKEKYNKPSIVISGGADGVCHASCRSTEGVNISDVICAGIEAGVIRSGGGHALAGGFVITEDNIPKLMEFLQKYPFPEVQPKKIFADCILSRRNVSEELIDSINILAPFGEANRAPYFVIDDLVISSAGIIGGQHMSVTFEGVPEIRGMAFKSVGTSLGDALKSKIGQRVSVLGTLTISTWRGQKNISMYIEDIA